MTDSYWKFDRGISGFEPISVQIKLKSLLNLTNGTSGWERGNWSKLLPRDGNIVTPPRIWLKKGKKKKIK